METLEAKKITQTDPSPIQPQAVPTSQALEKPKGNKTIWILCCGCLLLLVCCVILIACALILGPRFFPGTFKNLQIQNPSGSGLTKLDSNVSTERVTQEKTAVNNKIDSVDAQLQSLPAGSKVTLTLTEEELLYAVAGSILESNDSNAAQYLQYFSVGMEPGLLSVQIEAGKLIDAMKANGNGTQIPTGSLPFDPSMLNGLVVRLDLVPNSTNTGLQIQGFSTGNFFIDSFINVPGALDSINSELNSSLEQEVGEDGVKIDSLTISQDLMTIVFVK